MVSIVELEHIMEEGCIIYSSPVEQAIETRIGAEICISNMGSVVGDILSGNFPGKKMYVESEDIPIPTTNKSNPKIVRVGVELEGKSGGADEDEDDIVRLYIANVSKETVEFKTCTIRCDEAGSGFGFCTLPPFKLRQNERRKRTLIDAISSLTNGDLVVKFDLKGTRNLIFLHWTSLKPNSFPCEI